MIKGQSMKLIVFGATGGTGREVMQQALARGHEVTVFLRNPAKLGFTHPQLRVVTGDVFDAAAVAAALPGHDAVLSALGTKPWKQTTACSEGAANIIGGMKTHGLRRLIVVSTVGAGESYPWAGWFARNLFYRFVIPRAFADKSEMEHRVRASDLDWVIVRPVLLLNGPPQGSVRAASDGSVGRGSIRRSDVAAFCLEQTTSDRYLRQAPAIGGSQ